MYIVPHTDGRWKAVEEYRGEDGKRHSVSIIISDKKQKTQKEVREKLHKRIEKKGRKKKKKKRRC